VKRGAAERATVRLAARAKINLRLNVLAREASGYHQIETVFCALDLADDIEISLGGAALKLEADSPDGITVPAGAENIVYRAAQSFFETAQIDAAATIRLRKRIPVGAGLGGGSSDAATALRGLNLLCRSPLTDEQLIDIGAALGSDVAFFLCGSSLALGWGRGQRLLPLDPLPSVPALLVVPPFSIETKNAYEMLSAGNALAGRARVIDPRRLANWEALREDASNDFEPALFPRHPLLAELKSTLLEAGAKTALLSGSGSTLFGLFDVERAATRAAKRVRDRLPNVRTIETSTIAWTGR
jgi:4-diphosphocytidyl-2-C-methyl-D-erythritol kinase